MYKYSNNKPHDPHGFKEETKIKFDAIKAVAENFSKGTGAMIKLLERERPAVDWAGYCALTPVQQFLWEERGDNLTKLMLFTMNSKNENTKEDLRLAYS